MIYGIFLPDEVLADVYYRNAERVLSGTAAATTAKPAGTPGFQQRAHSMVPPTLRIPKTDDFVVTGDGSTANWKAAAWTLLTQRGSANSARTQLETQFKMLYSERGIYVLLQGADRKVTATLDKDFTQLWTEDVFEFFLWTDESQPVYFEYEISPLGFELPILCPNRGSGDFLRWLPWNYDGERRIKKQVAVTGGEAKNGAAISSWSAEVFVPYEVLNPLQNIPPQAGTRWRANVYRMDYDDNQAASWNWAQVGNSFHEFSKFGTLLFE